VLWVGCYREGYANGLIVAHGDVVAGLKRWIVSVSGLVLVLKSELDVGKYRKACAVVLEKADVSSDCRVWVRDGMVALIGRLVDG
jgi:hypothetical protein